MKQVVAIDLGAESGRVLRVGFDGSAFHFEELHRFPNIPVQARGNPVLGCPASLARNHHRP